MIDTIFDYFAICRMQFCFVFFETSNVTDHHQGPKQKLRAHYRAPSRHRRAKCRRSYFCPLDVSSLCNAYRIFHRRVQYCALSLPYVRAMRVFEVRHHPHPWATFVPNFVSVAPSIAELAHGENGVYSLLSHSVSHSPGLFDVPGTEAFASERTLDFQAAGAGASSSATVFWLIQVISSSFCTYLFA